MYIPKNIYMVQFIVVTAKNYTLQYFLSGSTKNQRVFYESFHKVFDASLICQSKRLREFSFFKFPINYTGKYSAMGALSLISCKQEVF